MKHSHKEVTSTEKAELEQFLRNPPSPSVSHAALLRLESHYLTPLSSPYQCQAISPHDSRNSERVEVPQTVQGSRIYEEKSGEGVQRPNSDFSRERYDYDSTARQTVWALQEDQAIFERILMPSLPKTESFEKYNPPASSYDSRSRPVNAVQLHCEASTGDHNTLHLPLSIDPLPENRWNQAREYRRMVHEPPYLNPLTDPTIAGVNRDAEFWVGQLVLAMTNIQNVKDTEGSHAKKMFLPGTYDNLLVEASCRQIFVCLMDRCVNGFRGPRQFNKALKHAKDSEADKTATCEERLHNVIQALKWNKRVCKDVLFEDWKIMLLVNHPVAYDKEKDAQKESNDQRRERQQNERKKLKRTEEELRAYRLARHQEVRDRNYRNDNSGILHFNAEYEGCPYTHGDGWLEKSSLVKEEIETRHVAGAGNKRTETEDSDIDIASVKRQWFG